MGYFKIKRDILSPGPLITWFIKSQAQLHIYSSSEAVLTPKDDLQSLSAQLTCWLCLWEAGQAPGGAPSTCSPPLCLPPPVGGQLGRAEGGCSNDHGKGKVEVGKDKILDRYWGYFSLGYDRTPDQRKKQNDS